MYICIYVYMYICTYVHMYIDSSDLINTPSFFLVALNIETDPNGRASCRSFHLEWCRAAGQGGCFPAAYLMAQELKWGSGGQGGCSNHPATNEPLVKCEKLILDMCGRGMGRDERTFISGCQPS